MIQPNPNIQKLTFDAAVETDTGQVREHNEDHHLISPRLALYAVCDGMGGHQAGELASEIAVDIIPRALVNGHASGEASAEKLLAEALLAAHKAIREAAGQDASRLGMGTTAVIVWAPAPGDVAWVAHVGDSRAYLWRNGQLEHLTEDHTWFNQIRRAGHLPTNPDEWPNRHVLSQALGASTAIVPEVSQLTLLANDKLLLCSDGLTDMLDDGEICRQISNGRTPQAICEALVKEANRLGGKDNITVIVLRVVPSLNTLVSAEG